MAKERPAISTAVLELVHIRRAPTASPQRTTPLSPPNDRHIPRLPKPRRHILRRASRRHLLRLRHPIIERLLDDPRRHAHRHLVQVVDRRVHFAPREPLLLGELGQRVGRREHHAVGDLARLRQDRAEAEPGEDERVVALPDRRTSCPCTRTGANGLPVATIARPSVHSMSSSGSASHALVGFDSGKMIGRASCSRHHRAHHRLVERARLPREAEQHGRPRRSRSSPAATAPRPRSSSRRGAPDPARTTSCTAPSIDRDVEQPLGVEDEDARPRLGLASGRRAPCPRGSPRPRRAAGAGAVDDDALIAQPLAAQLARVEQRPRAPPRRCPGCRR